jgi:hypothetical protein
MSNFQEPASGDAHAVEETGKERKAQGQNLRFTPLRSYVGRTQALAKQPRGESALSRLVPAPRRQS